MACDKTLEGGYRGPDDLTHYMSAVSRLRQELHAAEAERDKLKRQLEWLREQGVQVLWGGWSSFGGYMARAYEGSPQPPSEFNAALDAAIDSPAPTGERE